jgi:prophage regulatory protein
MTQQHSSIPHDLRILRRREVQVRTGLSRSSIYRRAEDGTFPQPVQLGPRTVGWVEAEVQSWIEQRIRDSRAPRSLATRKADGE